MNKKTFELTEDHIKLLGHMYVSWFHCETGAPTIDPKRPYGNSDVAEDIYEILTGESLEEELAPHLADKCMATHAQMETALQIVLQHKSFDTGVFEKEEFGVDWVYAGEIKEFKKKMYPGDKIVNNDGTPIFGDIMIATYEGGNPVFGTHHLKEIPGAFMGPNFRKATEEEIYWLDTLGRQKIGDFRELDVLKVQGDFLQVFENMGCNQYKSHVSPEFAQQLYKDGLLHSISPGEAYKPLPKEEKQ